MSIGQWAIWRWIRGLIPTVVILLLVSLVGCVCYLSILGAPSFLVERVEAELKKEGFPVEIGTLKISFWPRAVLKAQDVTLRDPGAIDEEGVAVATLEELDMAVNWKKLLDGEFQPDLLNIKGLEVHLPVDEENPERILKVQGLKGKIDLSREGAVDIVQSGALVQGIRVNVNGAFTSRDGGGETGDSTQPEPVMTAETFNDLKKELNIVLKHLEKLKWPADSPPRLTVNLSDDLCADGVRVAMELRAPELRYGGIHVKDFLLSGDFVDSVLMVNRLVLRDARGGGTVNFSLQADVEKRQVVWDVHSSAPLVAWTMSVTKGRLLPKEMQLHCEPRVHMNGRAEFNEDWSEPVHLSMSGSTKLGAFSLFGEKFRQASAEFSYKDGDFYVKDLEIRHADGRFSGQVMNVDGALKLRARSTLPVQAMLNMVKSLAPEDAKLPDSLEIKGKPDIYVHGTLAMKDAATDAVKTERVTANIKVSDVSYRGVKFDYAAGELSLIGKSVNVNNLVLKHTEGVINFKGSYLGTDVVGILDCDLKPPVLATLLKDYVKIPEQLTLPESVDLKLVFMLDIQDDKSVNPTQIRTSLKAEHLAWNGVPVNFADVAAHYRNGLLTVTNCRLEFEDGVFEVFAEGFPEGRMSMLGQSSVPLPTIEKLMGLKDDDFFMERFGFKDDSTLSMSFQGTLGMYHLDKAYDFLLTLEAKNTIYQGTTLKRAFCNAHLMTDNLLLKDVMLETDNAPYKAEKKLSGLAVSELKADSIYFDFNKNTVDVRSISGKVYPPYVIRMFSPAAAKVLKEFTFTAPATLSGGGLFPLSDDLSAMKARIGFKATSGRVRYKLLGTTLNMSDVRGDVVISPEWVVVDNLKGGIWEGKFRGRVLAQIDNGDALNGSFVLEDMNLSSIGKSYDTEMQKASVHGAIDFTSKGGRVNSIQAKGEAALVHGNLVEIPIFGFLGEALSDYIPGLGHLINYSINRADCDFTIEKGYIKTGNFSAKGSNMALDGGGWIRISDLMVDSDFRLGLRGLPGIITQPLFWVAGGLFQVQGEGPLNDVKWSFAPFSDGHPPVPPTPDDNKKPKGKKGK